MLKVFLASWKPKDGLFVRGRYREEKDGKLTLVAGSVEISNTNGKSWAKVENPKFIIDALEKADEKDVTYELVGE